MWCGVKRQAAEAVGWWGRLETRWKNYHYGRGGREWVLNQERGDTKTDDTDGRGGRREDGIKRPRKRLRKMVRTGL